MNTILSRGHVAEVAGWDGSFSLPERVLQKLWLRREFSQVGNLQDGGAWRLLEPGRWNLQGGPDFLRGRWTAEGRECCGDVEIHLRARDWFRHGHHEDPAYNEVGLHVVLFPPGQGEPWPRKASGDPVPYQLPLLPLLRCGLEELAMEDALAGLCGRDFFGLAEAWSGRSPEELRGVCLAHARGRWVSKCGFARQRIERFGWTEACHLAALEVLGLRSNRAAMATIGARWSFEAFVAQSPSIEELLEHPGAAWQWRGVRPANRPDARLRQYAAWVRARPDWPARLQTWCARGSDCGHDAETVLGAVAEVRNRLSAGKRIETFAGEVTGDAVGGSRLVNLIADLALPFHAASGSNGGTAGGEALWLALPPADAPDEVVRILRAGGLLDRRNPLCNGLVQAVLGALLETRR